MDRMGAEGRRFQKEGIYVYIYLVHFNVKQTLTQHYKAIILQFKKTKQNKIGVITQVYQAGAKISELRQTTFPLSKDSFSHWSPSKRHFQTPLLLRDHTRYHLPPVRVMAGPWQLHA